MLPGFRSTEVQSTFPGQDHHDQPLTKGHGQIRVLLGDFCEELTIQLLSSRKCLVRRFRTASSHHGSNVAYCPDIGVWLKRRGQNNPATNQPTNSPRTYTAYPNLFLEVKCVGNTNATLIYKGRLERDTEFTAEHDLYYLLYHHRLDTATCRTTYELRCGFLANLRAIYLLPFTSILKAAEDSPCTRLNSAYGHSDTNAAVYGEGYRIPIRKLREQPHLKIPFSFLLSRKELF